MRIEPVIVRQDVEVINNEGRLCEPFLCTESRTEKGKKTRVQSPESDTERDTRDERERERARERVGCSFFRVCSACFD